MPPKEVCKWTKLIVLMPIVIAIIAFSISPSVLAFPPINAPLESQSIPTNATKSKDGAIVGSFPTPQNETGSRKQVSINIARGSDSPSNSKFYVPSVLNVSKGDTVIWKNQDTTLHTVTSGSPGGTNLGTEFDSDYVAAGKTFQHTFNKTGTFDYFCTLHPSMIGEIKVSLSSIRNQIK
jgi:plastocyanin